MKPQLVGALTVLVLAGCQMPLVSVRDIRHDISFEVNGKPVTNVQNFRCHFEDVTWISSRGKDWHIRESVNAARIQGALPAGKRYQAIVRQSNTVYASVVDSELCVGDSQAVESYLYVESKPGRVERFDRTRTVGLDLRIQNLQSRLTVLGKATDTFKEHKDWPARVHPSSRYYTISMTIYADRGNVKAFVQAWKIQRLTENETYPFDTWSADDVALARSRQFDKGLHIYFPIGAEKIAFRPTGDAWSPALNAREAVQWLESPTKENDLRQRLVTAATTPKVWVLYNGSRIQVPLGTFYRFFYEPNLNRLVQFRAEEVDLW